jgi:hypothetical protein
VSRVRRVHAGQQERMAQMGNRGLLARLGSMAGTALMVLTALVGFEVLQERRGRRARPARKARPDLLEKQGRLDRLAHPDLSDHLAARANQGQSGPRVIPDRLGLKVNRAR